MKPFTLNISPSFVAFFFFLVKRTVHNSFLFLLLTPFRLIIFASSSHTVIQVCNSLYVESSLKFDVVLLNS